MTKRLGSACFLAAALALLVPASSATRALKDGGTFRVGVDATYVSAVDPAIAANQNGFIPAQRPACGTLMAYPDERLPAGLVLAPELAENDPGVSKDGKTYTFTIRKDAASRRGHR